jgi:hypothetical protein
MPKPSLADRLWILTGNVGHLESLMAV